MSSQETSLESLLPVPNVLDNTVGRAWLLKGIQAAHVIGPDALIMYDNGFFLIPVSVQVGHRCAVPLHLPSTNACTVAPSAHRTLNYCLYSEEPKCQPYLSNMTVNNTDMSKKYILFLLWK